MPTLTPEFTQKVLKRSQDLTREVIAMLEQAQWIEAFRYDALTKMQVLDKYLTSLRRSD